MSPARGSSSRARRARHTPRSTRIWIASLAAVTSLVVWLCLGGADAATRVGLSASQLVPLSRVDNAEGGPPAGRDPAGLRQVSLAEAARGPNGIGTWGVKPARGVKPGTALRRPGDVLPHRTATGVTSGGCLIGYGDPRGSMRSRSQPGRPTAHLQLSDLAVPHRRPRRTRRSPAARQQSRRPGVRARSGDTGVPLDRHK